MEVKIAVIGLGYVGLPLAVEFSKHYEVLGYDENKKRIASLQEGKDYTEEVSSERLTQAKIQYTDSACDLANSNFYIIAVPTPVDSNNNPDFEPLRWASKNLGAYLKKGDIVVYESTVYPGATEDICIPSLEFCSGGLKAGIDFKVGYSPERINPGDKKHTLTNIVKLVSAQDVESLETVANVYQSILENPVCRVSSIKVAEAAKVLENTQRDVNIALMNEASRIFNKIGIDTLEVLAACETKWNFCQFKPGLVGGHCIGVDPYYLINLANQVGAPSDLMQTARYSNEMVVSDVCWKAMVHLVSIGDLSKRMITIMGTTFKENCPDVRNSKAYEIAENFRKVFGVAVQLYDPYVHPEKKLEKADVVIFTVAHREFEKMGVKELRPLGTSNTLMIDVRGIFNRTAIVHKLNWKYWRL
jgi:UDP-N-acetyl-D-galactosamine dehydrogenase